MTKISSSQTSKRDRLNLGHMYLPFRAAEKHNVIYLISGSSLQVYLFRYQENLSQAFLQLLLTDARWMPVPLI